MEKRINRGQPLAMTSLLVVSALMAAIVPTSSRAQTSAVPPSNAAASQSREIAANSRVQQRREEAAQDAVKDSAVSSFEVITRGSAILNHSMGHDGTVLQMSGAIKGDKLIKGIMTGVDLGVAYVEGGRDGVQTELGQKMVDKAVGDSVEHALVER